MPVIHQLSPHIADLIAAGEVVERPASVVKELLENAVDAGATQITVEIQNGGMTFLRVTDNGCGMERADAETAFLRHATSKIKEADDLAAIHTLGFRGEALAAIASVSRIDLMTRTAQTEGLSLHLEAGTITARESAGCPAGTTMIVRDLFFNTPARMKFMKSDSAESAAVLAAVQRQALSHPEVSFRLLRDGHEQLSTSGDGDLHGAIYAILGRQFALDLVPVESRWEQYTLKGFVTKPTATRGNRAFEYFFVGGRPVKSAHLAAALERAYQNQMMSGRFPGCVLHLDLPAGQVDVNVHPAKTEVKFLREHDVFDAVHYGVLGALSRTPDRPELTLKPSAPQSAPRGDFYKQMSAEEFKTQTAPAKKKAQPPTDALPFTMPDYPETRTAPPPPREPVRGSASVASPRSSYIIEPPILHTVPDTLPHLAPLPEPEVEMQQDISLPDAADFRIIGETLETYFIVEQAEELIFIDKHAAHERILFERLRAEQGDLMSQLLIAPIPLQLAQEDAAALLEHSALLQRFGFELSDLGDNLLAVRQLPADLDEESASSVLETLAAQLRAGQSVDPASLRDNILHTIACKAAIKAGYHTEPREREALVREVLTREDIKYCPHGRPICITLTKSQLERQFKRA